MPTITIQVPVTPTTENRKIKLPYFCKGTCHYYKVNGEGYSDTVQMHDGFDSYRIDTVHCGLALSGLYEEITEAEFVAAYQRIRAKLDEMVFKTSA